MRELHALSRDTRALATRARALRDSLPESAPQQRRSALDEVVRETGELASRAQRLYGDAQREVAPLTGLQREQQAYYARMLAELRAGVR